MPRKLLDVDTFHRGCSVEEDREVTQKFADLLLEPVERFACDEVTVHYPKLESRGGTGYTKKYADAWERFEARKNKAALN